MIRKLFAATLAAALVAPAVRAEDKDVVDTAVGRNHSCSGQRRRPTVGEHGTFFLTDCR